MAEFAHYNNEDSDDDAPAERPQHVEHSPSHVEAEHTEVPHQEGTIFSRDKIASDLSRPLFDFIRNQEQPNAAPAEQAEPLSSAESLPGVSTPSEPETRTYQPPVEAEIARAIHEAAAEDDDDDEAADDSSTQYAQHGAVTPVVATPAPKPHEPAEHTLHINHGESSEPADEVEAVTETAVEQPRQHVEQTEPAAHQQEVERPLNEQFEEIMHAEMGEDYNRMTSGERLGETEDEPESDDPRLNPQAFVANWPHQQSEFAEPELPENDGEPDAFYYAESAPVEPVQSSPPGARRRRTGGGGGGVPPTGGTQAMAAGGMPPINGGLQYANNFNMAPLTPNANMLTSPLEMFTNPNKREKSHKGRYFVAGFITGWAVKQHLANKKMQKMNQEHQKASEAQQGQIDTLATTQHHMGERLKQTEGRLQEAATAATQQAARTAEAQATAREQQERMERAAAEAPLAAPAGGEQPAATEARAAETAPQRQATPAQESAVVQPNRMESTPLQYAAAAAEIPFAAAAAAGAGNVAERVPVPFAAEAQKTTSTPERSPKTPAEEAAELVEQAYRLQSGEHVEHATGGGHNIIVDSHGHEVQGAMTYGEEFKFQQRQEQVRPGAFNNTDDASKRQAQQSYDTGIITGLGGAAGGNPLAGDNPQLDSGSIGSNKRLPLGIPKSVNPQHLLRAKNQNPLVATVASPWLWASVIVLVVAFFLAAFI